MKLSPKTRPKQAKYLLAKTTGRYGWDNGDQVWEPKPVKKKEK